MATPSTSADVVASSSSTGGSPSTSRGEDDQRAVDEQTQFELLIAIERFLEGGNFGKAAAALRKEINQRKLVPARTDFEGTNHERNYHQFLSSMANAPGNITEHTLPTMISRLSTLSDRLIAPPVKGLKLRLITNKRSSLQKTNDVLLPPRRHSLLHGARGAAPVPKTKYSPIEILRAREMGARVTAAALPGAGAISEYDMHYKVWLHLSSCFCVTFDRTENYIITGADDNLIKVFNVNLGLLKFTYRGHASEIADITVSHCNQLVASASTDKVVRVWKLQNGETTSVLKCHQAGINSIRFLPFVENGNNRYLVTTGNDCIINFHMFNQETLEFPQGSASIAFTRNERDQHGAKMISICYSEGGHVVVAGESHGTLRVYRVHASGLIEKTNDIIAHTDRVDSLMWANRGMKFASGSKDGLVKIWRYQCAEWTETTLALCQEELVLICGMSAFQTNANAKNRYKISMICWTKDDSYLITTGSDYSFRVWDATDGTQLHKLSFHTDDVYHVLPHPIHPHVIFSAGHDGNVVAWDVVRGVRLRTMQYTVTTEPVSIYDLAVARNGTLLATVDNKGYLHVVGLGTNKQKFIKAQFFQTDYHPLYTDEAGFAVDANTGLAPHLMNPRLTNEKLELHPSEFQAMVPDRDYPGPTGRAGEDEVILPEMLVCPWLKTDIVPRLDEHEMEHWTARQAALSAAESEDFSREMQRVRADPAPIVPFNLSPVRAPRAAVSFGAAFAAERQAVRAENQRNRVATAIQMAQLRRNVSLRYLGMNPDGRQAERDAVPIDNDDDVAVADDDSDPGDGMTEDETETSDEDYESDGERRARRERERERARARGAETEAYSSQGTASRPRRRVEMEDDDDEEEMDESSQQSRSGRTQRRRRVFGEDEFGDDLSIDMNDVMLPSTSRGNRRTRRAPAPSSMEEEEERGSQEPPEGRVERTARGRGRGANRTRSPEDMEAREERAPVRRRPNENDEWRFTFPDWMTETKRRMFPCVAQPGDHVVYFRQGHENYINQVEAKRLYRIDSKMRPGNDIGMEEFAIVDDVKFILKPYRLIQLKLAKTDVDGRRTGFTWTVKHHDMPNVPDFIILRHYFDEGINMGLEVGDEIESAIDNQWWTGTVDNANNNDKYPNANWSSLRVLWESGEDDTISIWDVRRLTTTRNGQQPVTDEEAAAMADVPYVEGDWPEGDDQGEATRARVKSILETLAPLETNKEFAEPVPIDLFSDYPLAVVYPADLKTICERIDNQYYRRFRALLQDIRYVALAAIAYNEPTAVIVRNAKVLVEAVIRMANDPSIVNVVEFYDSCFDLSNDELVEYKRRPRPEVNSEMLDLLREADSARTNGGGDGAGGGPPIPGWILEAVEMLEALMQQPCARHFVTKDDENEELAAMWESCDDLTTLCERVRGCEMGTPKEVEGAVHELVSTAKNTIENRRSEIYKHAIELHSMFNTRFRAVISKFESLQASVQQTLGVSIDRSLRRRRSDRSQHAYNTRRSDQAALTAANLAAAAADYDDQPSTSRSAARHERGFYREMVNGRAGRASQETESSSTSSRATTGRRSARNGGGARGEMEEDEEPPQQHSQQRPSSQRASSRSRRVIVQREEEEEEVEEEERPEENEALAGYEAPTDDEVEVNPEVKEEEDDEEEEESEESEDEEEDSDEEYGASRSTRKRRKGSKRKKESSIDEEEEAASTSTASSSTATRRSGRVRKRPRLSSGDEEEEEAQPASRRSRTTSRVGGGRTSATTRQSTGRPTRSAPRATYNELTDDEEEETRVFQSVSQRGRQRRVRTFD